MTLLLFSCQHPLAGTSRARRRTPFIPASTEPAGHHRPVPNQPIEYDASHQFAIICSFQLSAIFTKPSAGNADAATNPHRQSSVHRFPAGSFFRGFRTPALYRVDRSCLGRHPKPFRLADLRRVYCSVSHLRREGLFWRSSLLRFFRKNGSPSIDLFAVVTVAKLTCSSVMSRCRRSPPCAPSGSPDNRDRRRGASSGRG
jgi:hypothetical protein